VKRWQFIVSLVLSALCLVFAVSTVLLVRSARSLQAEFERQQREIERAVSAQQTANSIVQDLIKVSDNNSEIRSFLQQHGLSLSSPARGTSAVAIPAAQKPAPAKPKTTTGVRAPVSRSGSRK
jgi:hypothetical protein